MEKQRVIVVGAGIGIHVSAIRDMLQRSAEFQLIELAEQQRKATDRMNDLSMSIKAAQPLYIPCETGKRKAQWKQEVRGRRK